MKKFIIAFFCLLPFKLPHLFLRLIGEKVDWSAKIGFSLLIVKKIELGEKSKIGHFNLIWNDTLSLKEKSYINHLNKITGPFKIELEKNAAIGNKNSVIRAPLGVAYEISTLKLGELSKITSNHYVDLTRNISFGKFSTLAGVRSQIWTHGYYHADKGKYRIRIDGNITIGDNVYLGSGCILNPGVNICNGVHIGAGTVISKNLDIPGMYVGQGLRYIENSIDDIKKKLKKVEGYKLIEDVYTKDS